jgi:hypothetical protein
LKTTGLGDAHAAAPPHREQLGHELAVELVVLDDQNLPGAWHAQCPVVDCVVPLESEMALSVIESSPLAGMDRPP